MIQTQLYEKLTGFTAPDELKRAGIYPYFRPIQEARDTEVVIHGRKLLMFGSNSYMGLTNHPRVKAAAKRAIDQFGSSCSGSRFLNGTSKLHVCLEERLAEMVGKEAALVFSTGFQTNLGTVSSVTGREGVLILDEMDHASIIEGSRLSFSRVLKFAHNDMSDLERILRQVGEEKIKMIVVDGVFSMEGDICDLPGITELANRYQALVMVDDAHGLGVLGQAGRGTADHFGLTAEVDIIMGTFSKSLASIGGFIGSTREMINYLKHHSRALIFSASIPPSCAAAALAALDIILEEPWRLDTLWDNTAYVMNALHELGFDTHTSRTPIVPVYIRDNELTFQFTQRLFEEGIFVNPVVSPAVPGDASLLRLSIMATHTRDQLNRALSALEKVSREFPVFKEKQV
jgi:8-amino-7-oxononanoate synthase